MLTVEIHPLHKDELILVDHFLPNPNNPSIHTDRLTRQSSQKVTYLVAWRDNMPLGHLLIVWDGAPDAYVRERVDLAPYLEDMHVLEEFRSLEVGSQLISTAENLIQGEGYSMASLAVAVENARAIALYQKHGFIESELGPYIINSTYRNEQNEMAVWETECIYMIKNLL